MRRLRTQCLILCFSQHFFHFNFILDKNLLSSEENNIEDLNSMEEENAYRVYYKCIIIIKEITLLIHHK